MPSYSDRTVATLAPLLEDRYNRQRMCAKLMEYGVPSELVDSLHQENKLRVAMAGLTHLRRAGMVSDLHSLVEEVVADDAVAPASLTRLKRALMADGFTVQDGGAVTGQLDEEEIRDALGVLIERHEEFEQDTLRHHLEQCERLYTEGRWDASIAQARNVCEQLLMDIAGAFARERGESPDLSRPVKVRDYLEQAGFLDQAERKKLIDGAYGYLSEEGSHPGISNQTSARVARLLIRGLAFYLIEKYEGQHPS